MSHFSLRESFRGRRRGDRHKEGEAAADIQRDVTKERLALLMPLCCVCVCMYVCVCLCMCMCVCVCPPDPKFSLFALKGILLPKSFVLFGEGRDDVERS